MKVNGGLSKLLLSWICWFPLASYAGAVVHDIVPIQDRIRSLQSGGHILVMRHGATDHSQKDLDRSLKPDCTMQRDLSAQGREELGAMRRSMQALRIPIGKVLSSPYCRAFHTADEVFNEYRVDADLQFSISKNSAEAKRLADYLYRTILNIETGSANSVIVTHTTNIRDSLGIWPKPEGAALVLEKTQSALIYKGMIKPSEWPLP